MSIKKEALNTAVSAVFSEHFLNPLHHVPMEMRRRGYTALTKRVLPTNYEDSNQSLKKAEELIKEGYGLVVALRHFSNSDFPRVMNVFRIASDLISTGRKICLPLAYHMHTPASVSVLDYMGVKSFPVVTNETIKKGKNIDKEGKILPLGSGSVAFIRNSRSTLNEGGLIFIAPSAHRVSHHEPWKDPSIDSLMRAKKVACMSVGVDILEIENYEKYRGFNRGLTYMVTLGELFEKEELQKKAKEKGISVDRFMADDMARLVSPQSLGQYYKELKDLRSPQMPKIFVR